MQVELGGGLRPEHSSAYIIDIHHPRNAPAQDATVTPWTTFDGEIKSGSVDRVFCSHFLEHIPSGSSRIAVMNEAWRVLKPGGRFDMILPLVGYTDQGGSGHLVEGWQPWADPTHVGFWWFPESLLYFCEGPFKPLADYGISVWKALGDFTENPFESENGGWHVGDGWEGRASLIKP